MRNAEECESLLRDLARLQDDVRLVACADTLKAQSLKLDMAVKALHDWRNTLCTRASPVAEQTFAVIDSHGGEVAYIDYVIEKCGGPKS